MGFPAIQDPARHCRTCGAVLERKRFNGRLEDRTRFLSRQTCSQRCGNTKAQVEKSSHHWRARRHRQSTCEECGATTRLHVHHRDRDHANDAVENLATLCASCHLKLHWREDRESRMAAIRRGVLTRQRSRAGSRSSGG